MTNNALVSVDSNGQFVQNGETFVPQGVCSYPLLELAGRNEMQSVHDIFRQASDLGRPVVRTNAFFDGGESVARIRNDDGSLREEGLQGLDRLLAAAAEDGVSLILSLTNNWHDYGGAEAILRAVAPGESLPKDAFWTDSRAVAMQRAYIDTLVMRTNTVNGRAYKSDPTVFAWELANEARCDDSSLCAPDTLVVWARTMATQVRAAGAAQLVAWGGIGYLGEHGEDLEALAADGAVDVLTVHMYPMARLDTDSTAARILRYVTGAGVGASRVRDAGRLARRYGAAMLIEEFGWRPLLDDRDKERALVVREWVAAAQEEGIGTFPWMIGEPNRPDYDGFLIRPDEDVLTAAVLRCL